MLRLRPRPKLFPIPAFATLLVFVLGISLGNWQTRRALEKDLIEGRHEQTRDAAELAVAADPVTLEQVDGRRVVLRGEFMPALSIYWDNQIVNHVPGFAIIVPLKLAGTDKVVLVDRGLLTASGDRAHLAAVPVPPGTVEVHGRAYFPPRRTLELKSGADQGQVWQNVTPAKFAQVYRLQAHDFILRETGPAPAGLMRMADNAGLLGGMSAGTPGAAAEAGMTAAKHRGYAFQWYSLAALTLLLFLLFTFMTYDDAARDA